MNCLCGCGNEVRKGSKFVSGHNSRVAGYRNALGLSKGWGWSKGLTKGTDDRVRLGAEKTSQRLLDYHSMRGRTYKDIYGDTQAEQILCERRKLRHSDETKKDISNYIKVLNRHDQNYRIRQVEGHKAEWKDDFERKRRQAEWARTAMYRAGKDHANWRGGISFEPYPLGWTRTYKEQIRYRDGYKCQVCGMPEVENGRKLDVHHIDYDKSNIQPENLASTCKKCHGKTNYNRQYWKDYFNELWVRRGLITTSC